MMEFYGRLQVYKLRLLQGFSGQFRDILARLVSWHGPPGCRLTADCNRAYPVGTHATYQMQHILYLGYVRDAPLSCPDSGITVQLLRNLGVDPPGSAVGIHCAGRSQLAPAGGL